MTDNEALGIHIGILECEAAMTEDTRLKAHFLARVATLRAIQNSLAEEADSDPD